MIKSKMPDQIVFKHITSELERKNHSRYILLKSTQKPRKVLIKGSPFIITANDKNEVQVLREHSIYIEDSEIKAVYPEGPKAINVKNLDLIYDAGARGGIVITPGFINAHDHVPMYLMRSAMLLDYAKDLDGTIAKMPIWQKHIDGAAAVISALGDLTEQQRGGITTTLNHNALFAEVDEAADVCGQRVINCVSAISNSRPDVTLEAAAKYIIAPKRELSVPGIAFHYLYKVNHALLLAVKKLQDQHQILVTLHFAESKGVVEQCVSKFGMRETKMLEKYGLLNPLTLLSHVLYVNNQEIEILVKNKVGIVHLPTSNSIHKSGVFNYPKFAELAGGERVALGTDSVVSKSRLDLLTEAFQTRITHLPNYTVYYEDLFKMITVNGARVLNQPKLGRIAPGCKADIAFWKLKDRGFLPFDENDPATLVGNIISHGGRNIRDLMINGRFIISNRMHNLVDESDLMEQIQYYHMEVRKLVNKEKISNKDICQ
ncbi:MAG: amidohydrolase family protein [Patescibacteria group bacterium]